MERKKRSRFSFWTPSIPFLESHLTFTSPFIPLYRLFRLSYLILTTPLHITCLVLSLPPLSLNFPSIFAPTWTFTQRLVYPFLRRLIWAVADIGDPNILTRSKESGVPPWWAEGLEWFTVKVGGGKKVSWEIERVGMTREAYEKDYVSEEVRGKEGGIEVKKVNLIWFERSEDQIERKAEGFEPKEGKERIVLYLFGGGFVCGSPGEGGRCYKIARETGLRVVGVNYRRATSKERAFPAALQDAFSAYFHLTLKLGYKDIILAGDSAGGGLALNLLQYLAGNVYPSLTNEEEKRNFVLPSATLLFSPWCDLTLDSFPEVNKFDIILPSICSNSVKAYLGPVRTLQDSQGGSYGSIDDHKRTSTNRNNDRNTADLLRISDYKDPSHHPWFSPSLRSSLSSLSLVSKSYSSSHRRQLRILVSLGTAELFHGSILSLIDNFRNVEYEEGFKLEVMEGKDEVHAFPLVPEWVSPNAVKAWIRLREWFKE